MKKMAFVLCCVTSLTAEAAFAGGTIGRTVGVTCNACHGPDGRSEGAIPSLVGMSAKQIESALHAFKFETRPATIMNRIAKGYTDKEIAAVAAYFANLE
jgi:cytochrome subunit of sulfide dehydrogenase